MTLIRGAEINLEATDAHNGETERNLGNLRSSKIADGHSLNDANRANNSVRSKTDTGSGLHGLVVLWCTDQARSLCLFRTSAGPEQRDLGVGPEARRGGGGHKKSGLTVRLPIAGLSPIVIKSKRNGETRQCAN